MIFKFVLGKGMQTGELFDLVDRGKPKESTSSLILVVQFLSLGA